MVALLYSPASLATIATCVRPLVCRLSLGTRRYGETAVKHRAITESSWKKVINNRAIPFQLGKSKWVGPVGPQEK